MANDRMFIRCKECGELLYLGKTFSDERGYFCVTRTPAQSGEMLYDFFRKHSTCGQAYITPANYYEIVYESDNDFNDTNIIGL